MTRDQITNIVMEPLMAFPQRKALGEMYLGHIFSGIDMIAGLGVRLYVGIGDNEPGEFTPTNIEHELFPGGMVVTDQSSLDKMLHQGWKVPKPISPLEPELPLEPENAPEKRKVSKGSV